MTKKMVRLVAWVGACILCAFVAFRITLLCCNMVYDGTYVLSDFYYHMNVTRHMMDDGFSGMLYSVSYPLWHLGTYLMHEILHSGWDVASAANTAFLYAVMFATYYYCFRKEKKKSIIWAICLAVYLIFVQPISRRGLLFVLSGRTQLISAWHNPTNIWPRIIAVPVVILFIKIWEREKKDSHVSIWNYVLFAVLLMVATLGKPSLVQVFFPAIFLFCGISCLAQKFHPFGTSLKLAVACIPSLLLMLWQASLSFDQGAGGGVELAWLKVMGATGKAHVVVILGTIAFPLYYFIAYRKWKNTSNTLILAWIMYGVSFLEYAALAEVGERTYHSNFGWGYMIALMILHMASALEFMEEDKGTKKIVGYLFLTMHLICGISWAMLEMTEKGLFCQMGLPY